MGGIGDGSGVRCSLAYRLAAHTQAMPLTDPQQAPVAQQPATVAIDTSSSMTADRQAGGRTPAAGFSAFRGYFVAYVTLAAGAAASPIIASLWDRMPVYDSRRGLVGVFATITCFLVLAFVFFSRHSLAPALFAGELMRGGASLPHTRRSRRVGHAYRLVASLILSSFLCMVAYAALIGHSIHEDRRINRLSVYRPGDTSRVHLTLAGRLGLRAADSAPSFDSLNRLIVARSTMLAQPGGTTSLATYVLATTDFDDVDYGWLLDVLFVAVFAFAEAAMAIMALREYLQDAIAVNDPEILQRLGMG
jgi:hypothetical protein